MSTDTTALATRDGGAAPTILEVIAQAARDPKVDVAKMGELLALKERIEAREAEMEFNRAMARLAPKLPIIKKRGVIDLGGKGKIPFARYEDLDRAIRPILTDEGFTLSFTSEPAPTGVLMVCTLAHILGHSTTSRMQLPADQGPGRNALQAIGSSRSYAKRYLACDILNIITEGQDDDGQAAGYLTAEQLDQMTTLVDACDLKEEGRKKFLAFAQADRLEHIQQRDFARCCEALKKKARVG